MPSLASRRLATRRLRGTCIAAQALIASIAAAQGVGVGAGTAAVGISARAGVNAPPAATVLPTGGTVVKGTGSISSSGSTLTVDQTSQRLIADWQSFSIGAGSTVRFVQPSSSAVALNRVTGNDPSQIFGALVANGHVYLQNASGVFFAPGAQVNVGSLVATTLQVDPAEFMNGNLRLLQGSGAAGTVENAGTITTAAGGSVVLAGPVVVNSGSITTPGGTTALVAGSAVDVDPTGSGLLNISVPAAAVNARLVQSGRIVADGGAVQLAAAATDAALRTVMQVDGVVRARSIEQRDGQIVLSGGASGTVQVGATLDASGPHGGTIKVLGDSIALTGQARLDASGATGGGTVLVGGNRQGGGSEQRAATTSVAAGASLDASAVSNGDGGKVVVWADGLTTFAGSIKATGGAAQGAGGEAEVSGKSRLDFAGDVDLRAPHGKSGTLLLDPTNLEIGFVADKNGDGTRGDDVTSSGVNDYDPGVNSRITAAQVANLLATTSLSLQAQNSLTVSAPINVSANGASTTLTLGAHTVNINAPLTLNNTSLSIYHSSDSISINIYAPITTFNDISLTGTTIDIFSAISSYNLNISTDGTATTAGGVQTGSIAAVYANINGGYGNGVVNFPNIKGVDGNLGNQITNLSFNNVRLANVRVDNDPGTVLNVSGFSLGELNLISASGVTSSDSCEGPCLNITGNFSLRTLDADPFTGGDSLAVQVGGRFSFNTASDLTVQAYGDLNAAGSAGGNLFLSTYGLFTMAGDITSLGSEMQIHGVGFNDAGNYNLSAPNGSFFVFSDDHTQDDLGTRLNFSGAGGDSTFNFEVFDTNGMEITSPDGFRGYGNGFFTDQTGTLTINSVGSIARTYDATTFLNLTVPVTATTLVGRAPLPDDIVGVYAPNGQFNTKNVGSGKGYTLPDDQNSIAYGESGALYFNLSSSGFVRPNGPARGNYGDSDVTPYQLAIDGLSANNKVYDATRRATLTGSASVSPLDEDNVTLGGTGTGTFGDKNVGTAKPVTITGYTLSGSDAANYTLILPTLLADITPATLALTGIAASNKVYDTTTVATITGNASVTPISGDSVAVGGSGTGSFADKNVGTGKAVTVGGYTLTGTDAGNYVIAAPTNLRASITPAQLVVAGLTAANKVYDARTGATLGGTAGVTALGSDAVGLAGTAAGSFANKNVGNAKAVTVSGLSLTGADAANYTIVQQPGLTANITPASLAITGIAASSKTYDATTGAALTGTARVTAIAGDSVGVGGTGSGNFTDKNVGTGKAVSVSGYTLTGADAGNYSVVEPAGLTANITPALLAVTGIGAANKVYDATTAATLTGTARVAALGSDAVGLTGTGSGSFTDKNAGTGKAVTVVGYGLTGADAGNYTIVEPTGVTAIITPAPLAIGGLTAANKVYDATTTATLTGTASVAPIGNDAVSVTGTGTGRFADKNVGTGKPVSLTGFTLSGADAANYVAVAPTGLRADISALVLMPVGITATSRENNGSTTVSLDTSQAKVPGVLPGDTVALVTSGAVGTVSSPDPGPNKPVTVTGLTLGGTDALNYSIVSPNGVNTVTVTIVSAAERIFGQLRYSEYLQAVADAQEPFRRAIAESLAAGFGKENIRKRLARGQVFETGLAPPAIDAIQPPALPASCPASPAPGTLGC